jgi:protein-S-isoprenylcysteine O-methyltransferase Ste14
VLRSLAFWVGVAAASAHLVALGATLLVEEFRFWPPGGRNWKFATHWEADLGLNASLLVVAVVDWNAWLLPRPASLVVGVVLAALGAARSFTVRQSAGLAGGLRTDGLYARSRNPQYVGMIVGVAGVALAANSALVAVLAALHVLRDVLLAVVEEPWLSDRFGDEYDRYAEEVPRFLGPGSL